MEFKSGKTMHAPRALRKRKIVKTPLWTAASGLPDAPKNTKGVTQMCG